MKNLLVICMVMYVFVLAAGSAFGAQYQAGSTTMTLNVGQCQTRTVSIDCADFGTSRLVGGGFYLDNSGTLVSINPDVLVYDGVERTPAVWDPGAFEVPDPGDPPAVGDYFLVVGNLGNGVLPAAGVLIADVQFCCASPGQSTITFRVLDPALGFDLWVNQNQVSLDSQVSPFVMTVNCVGGAVCGNGLVEAGEQCDPPGPCCTAGCTFAPQGTSCSDGLFCNGNETCNASGTCQPGTPVDCNDGVACTVDSCNEAADRCDHSIDSDYCNRVDGLYCNGVEVCDPVLDCQPGAPVVCPEGSICNEFTDECTVVGGALPDTGQTACYNNSAAIACPNPGAAFYGQDAQYGPNVQSFTKLDENGNALPDNAPWPWAMVRDNVTALVWEIKRDDGSIHDKDDTYTWQDAQDEFITALNNTGFGGYNDWRLPTVKELSSILDSSVAYPGPTTRTSYFPTMMSWHYWSSTPKIGVPNSTWIVDFQSGGVGSDDNSSDYNYVVAVRGGRPASSGNFIDNSDGTVTDLTTGLMWQKESAPGTYSWQQALAYCENLTLAAYTDWRLPNRNELQSIVDYARAYPSTAPVFSRTVSSWYWSSTTKATYPDSAWLVIFTDGRVDGGYKQFDFYSHVRAVRGEQCGSLGDADGDTMCNNVDNCPDNYNPLQIDCDNDGRGDICDADVIDPDNDGLDSACDNCPGISSPNPFDTYPPGGNGCGDACDCEGNFDGDRDVDSSDTAQFKRDYGRSVIFNPCTNALPCKGDFICDGDVDSSDAALFKQDYGRSKLVNPCPLCATGLWCVYP